MKLQPAVKRETAKIALGTTALACVLLLVFFALKRLDVTVVCGAALGTVCAVLNFFLMALSVQRSAETMSAVSLPPLPAEEDETDETEEATPPLSAEGKKVKSRMQLSYHLRLMMIGAVCALAIISPLFHPVAALVCLLFPRIVIFAMGLLEHRTPKEGA